jgi:hypothetical protein
MGGTAPTANCLSIDTKGKIMIVTTSTSKDHFRLHFETGVSQAYPLCTLASKMKFYRRMARLHRHPSYQAIASALEQLERSLEGGSV